MGCGQSKINLYPRRNKSGGKGQNGKKTGGGDSKDGEEEETGGAGESLTSKDSEGHSREDGDTKMQKEKPKIPVPPHGLGHAATVTEISASQQDFFKMLDEKIEKGRDYDSSSETEIQIEQARVASLLMHWESASQTSSQCNHSSPPTPSRRRQNSQERQSNIQQYIGEQPRSPDLRRCMKSQPIRSQTQPNTPASPPPRRSHSSPHAYQSNQDYSDKSESPKQTYETSTSSPPSKRAQTASPNWKVNPKSATYNPKSGQKIESYDEQRCYSPNLLSQREIHQSYGVSQEYMDSSRDTSQITYNPTFQSHSPAHGPNKMPNSPAFNTQPYIAQIITYPMSQQAVSFHNPNKYISQPTTYQQQPGTSGVQRYPGRAQIGVNQQQPNIYYIAPSAIVSQQMQEQLLTPKQQTALHLQQYVAMKQAQQVMGYSQRIGGTQTPQEFAQYSTSPSDSTAGYARKVYERLDDNYSLNYMPRQPIAPKNTIPTQPIRQIAPSIVQLQQSMSIPQYNTLIPKAQSVQNVQAFQNRPGCTASLGRNQSLNHKEMMAAERYGLINPTNTNSPQNSISIRNNVCQSLNIVTQKTVGQIVPMGGQDLMIYQNVVDGDGRKRAGEPNITLGPDNSLTNINSMMLDNKPNRDQFFTPGGEQCQVMNPSATDQKSVTKQHLGSNIVGRQMYYSQVVSGSDPKISSSNDIGAKKTPSETALKTGRPANQKNSLENSSAGGYL